MVVWFILRYTILRLDHGIIWWAAIIICIIALWLKLKWVSDHPENEEKKAIGFYAKKYANWKSHFIYKAHSKFNKDRLKRKLQELLVTLYAVRKRLAINYEITDLFRNKKIQLPENIYSFFFTETKEKEKRFSIKRFYNSLSGHDAVEYYKNLDESLTYIENYLENRND